MRRIIGLCLIVSVLFAAVGYARTEKGGVKPDVAIKWLEDGNARFVSGKAIHPHQDADWRKETVDKGQHPYATIVSCSDSRVPVEVVFDEGIGELFIIRVAGNVCAVNEIGSAEYGVDHLGTQLVVVLGHSHCGAVTAVATEAAVHGNIAQLVAPIKPAVEQAKKEHPDLKGKDLVPAAVEANVWQGIENVLTNSEIIRQHVKAGTAKIVGAIYDLETGRVAWLGTHPRQAELLKTPAKEGARTHEAPANHEPTEKKHAPTKEQAVVEPKKESTHPATGH